MNRQVSENVPAAPGKEAGDRPGSFMAIVRTFSIDPGDDFIFPYGSGEAGNAQTIVLRDGSFATVAETYSGDSTNVTLRFSDNNSTLTLFDSSDPRAVDGYDLDGHAAVELTYTRSDGHVYVYRAIEDLSDTGFHVDLGIGYNSDIAGSGFAIHTAVAYQYDYSSTDTDIIVKILDENGTVTKTFTVDNSDAKDTDMQIANA